MDIDTCVFDMKQLFFNSLCLLGFDAQAMEASHKIPFNKNMFELPNKHGAEIVLHFLFQRLNATMCKEAFRDCWPILDKKREQSFRKNCYNWLSKISQEEPDSHLPRINASLFLSPGGDKFYQMLFHFSGYVLQKVVETELGSKLTDRLRYPTLNTDNLQIGDVVMKTLTCSSIRHRNNYFNAAQLKMKVNREWKETADDYVKHYRKLNKEIRELDFQYREEEQRSIEAALARGSPAKRRSGQSDKFDPEFDPRTIKRSQRIQQVREMWKQVEDYDRNKEAEVEVVESIVQKTINKYKLDAADINVKVPDMLLRECGDEIRRRNVDNTYQGGKLNLVSVLQLWSLCLHLYLEKINQVGLPKFGEEVKKLTAQAHLQQNYKKNSQTLRQQMSERVPLLKASIEKLTQKLDSTLFVDKSPESIRTTVSGPVNSKLPTASHDFDSHRNVKCKPDSRKMQTVSRYVECCNTVWSNKPKPVSEYVQTVSQNVESHKSSKTVDSKTVSRNVRTGYQTVEGSKSSRPVDSISVSRMESQNVSCSKPSSTVDNKPSRLNDRESGLQVKEKIFPKQSNLLGGRTTGKLLYAMNTDNVPGVNTESSSKQTQNVISKTGRKNVRSKIDEKLDTDESNDYHCKAQGIVKLAQNPDSKSSVTSNTANAGSCINRPYSKKSGSRVVNSSLYTDSGPGFCMECGSSCVCNKTAVAMTSICDRSSLSHSSYSQDISSSVDDKSQSNKLASSVDQPVILDITESLDDTLKTAGSLSDSVATEIEPGTKPFNAEQDCRNKLITSNHPDVSGVSSSSGYYSSKSKRSASPVDDLGSYNKSDDQDSSSVESVNILADATLPRSVEQSDTQQAIDKYICDLSVSDSAKKFSPSKPVTKFLPLKDMEVDRLLTPKSVHRHIRQTNSPLFDESFKTVHDVSVADREISHLKPVDRITDRVGLSFSGISFSPLKDMSLQNDTDSLITHNNTVVVRVGCDGQASGSMPSRFGSGYTRQTEVAKPHVSKYLELKDQSDDIITIGSPSILDSNMIDLTQADRGSLNSINVSAMIDLTKSDQEGLPKTSVTRNCNTSLNVLEARVLELPDCFEDFGVNDVISSDVERCKTAYRFIRSPRGTLKHVRFTLPSDD